MLHGEIKVVISVSQKRFAYNFFFLFFLCDKQFSHPCVFPERPLHYQERVLPILHALGTDSHLVIKKHLAMEAMITYLCKPTHSMWSCLFITIHTFRVLHVTTFPSDASAHQLVKRTHPNMGWWNSEKSEASWDWDWPLDISMTDTSSSTPAHSECTKKSE